MPRPATLPAINWHDVFNSGATWSDWLSAADSTDQAQRMGDRLEALALPEEQQPVLEAVTRPVYVVAIAEDWCGDVVRHAPVMARIEQSQPLVQVRYIARIDHPDVFARFLTNGGEAIPKFIFLSSDWVECGNWGPMQADCRQLISRGKACGSVGDARKLVSDIYQADPACHIAFKELCELVELASAESVE